MGARDNGGLDDSIAVVDEREVWNLELCLCGGGWRMGGGY